MAFTTLLHVIRKTTLMINQKKLSGEKKKKETEILELQERKSEIKNSCKGLTKVTDSPGK